MILDYTYDVIPSTQPEAEPAGAPPTPVAAGAAEIEPKVVGASEKPLTLEGEPEAVPVAIDGRAREEVEEASRQADPRRLYLNIENIEGEKNPGTVYGVYLNLPEDPDEETLAKHYAGDISFFGIEHTRKPPKDEHGHQLRYVLEVGQLLRSLGDGEQFGGEEVKVTFRPLALLPPEGGDEEDLQAAAEEAPVAEPEEEPAVQIGRVSLSVGE